MTTEQWRDNPKIQDVGKYIPRDHTDRLGAAQRFYCPMNIHEIDEY